MKSVQDGLRHNPAWPVETMPNGVAYARGNLAVDREGLAPRRSVAGRGRNALTRTEELFEDAPRSAGPSNPDTRAAVSRLTFRTAHWPSAAHRRLYDFKSETGERRIERGGKDRVAVVDDETVRVV